MTALLQAMAPALIQSGWSMRIAEERSRPVALVTRPDPSATVRARIGRNLNTCHVWAEDGEVVARIERGERVGPGLPIRDRLAARGQDPDGWWDRQT